MNILHICKSDLTGGASRASFRINESLNKDPKLNINSKMRVIIKKSSEKNIISKNNIFHNYLFPKFISLMNKTYRKGFNTQNKVTHSTAILNTGLAKELNNRDIFKKIDIFHLHWLGDVTLSIKEIGSLNKPIIWTMHDQWPFLGSEHYVLNEEEIEQKRYLNCYCRSGRPKNESGFDINRLTWLRKRKAWTKKMNIICPSNWMAECVKKSSLFNQNPVYTIPNPIDLQKWKPINKDFARNKLSISSKRKVILFGALKAIDDDRKGIKLLIKALKILKLLLRKDEQEKIEIIIFGDYAHKTKLNFSFPNKFTGQIKDDQKLNLIYSAADVFVNPSLLESFGQTATEAHSCGTPVVAFKTSGLIDIVDHLKTGYLAEAFDVNELAHGIKWTLEDKDRNIKLSENSLLKARREWDYPIVSKMYASVYRNILNIK